MSGRAGRRGIDDKGIVILMVDEKVPPAAGRNIVKGLPDPINSAFHLTYNMVLNLLRVEEINPEYMLERSFYQFQNQTAIPGLYDSEFSGFFYLFRLVLKLIRNCFKANYVIKKGGKFQTQKPLKNKLFCKAFCNFLFWWFFI